MMPCYLRASVLRGIAATLLLLGGQHAAAQQPPAERAWRVGDRLDSARAQQGTGDHETVTWEALLPRGWDPSKLLEEMKLEELQDNDPRAREVMKKIRDMWNAAPVNPDLHQRRVRIAGFVVPLEGTRTRLREFLLVPYFGACLHLPPPPANQIIHVVVPETTQSAKPSNAAWISGTLQIVRSETKMAAAAYKVVADAVEPFTREWSPF